MLFDRQFEIAEVGREASDSVTRAGHQNTKPKTIMIKTLEEKAADWDMGTGENEGQPQPAPVPGAATWRKTATPAPTATHGIQDAAGVLPDRAKAPQGGNLYGGNMPDLWLYDTEPFPDDAQKCWAEVRKIDAYYFSNARSAAATTECFRRRRLVGAKIMELCNGPKAPEMTSDMIAEMQRARNERPAAMKSRIAALTAYLATPAPSPFVLDMDGDAADAGVRVKLGMSPKTRVLLHPEVVQRVEIARRLGCEAELFSLDNYDLIYPVEFSQFLERELHTSQDPTHIRELQEKIAKALSSTRATELAIKGVALEKWEPVFTVLRSAIILCDWLVSQWELESVLAEDDFFASFGLDRHPTFLSKQFTDFRAELGKLNVSKSTFAWLGVNDIAKSDD